MPEEESPTPLNVGQQLKRRRMAMHKSLADIEVATKIRGKFLTALEAGDYSALPNDIYSRGFVQHYANYLGLDGVAMAMAYVSERGGISQADTKAPQLQRPKRMVVTARLATFAGVLLAVVAVVLYLSYQFSALAAPPRLTVDQPRTNAEVTSSLITISGSTTPGSDVFVNDSALMSDADGNFSGQLALQDGVNSIRISSRSKLGKTTTVTRNVVANLPSTETAVSVPTATFAGVAIAVKAQGAATSIIVTVDGKQQFDGILVDGKSMLFSGQDIKLTTGNAGVTQVTVTNSLVAGHIIAALGTDGQIITSQDFAAGTKF